MLHSELMATPDPVPINVPHGVDEVSGCEPHVTSRLLEGAISGGSHEVEPPAMHSSHDQLDLLPQQSKPHAPAGPTNSGLVNTVDMLQEGFVPITHVGPHAQPFPSSDGSQRHHSMRTRAMDGIFKPKRLMATRYPLPMALQTTLIPAKPTRYS